jgi:protein-tyrosine phosphatase
MAHYVDLHTHFLPGLDDGARTAEDSMDMLSTLAGLGFTTVNATPHQRDGMFMPSRAAIDEAFAATQARAQAELPGVTLGLAAENFWDEVLHARLFGGGELPCYQGGRSFLFELNPHMMPPRIETSLFDVRIGGKLPVMAHPERYTAVQEDVSRAEALGRCSALVVDLGALDGAHGRPQMKTARRLLEEGLVHAATSDLHRASDGRAVAAGITWIRKRLGPEALERLLVDNPRRIVNGELPG